LGATGIAYITVTPASPGNGNLSRQNRRITFEGSGLLTFYGVNTAALDTVRPWADPDSLRVAVTGDSYSEGQGTAVPGNNAWSRTLGRLMGWADTRQVAVGSTGYIANATGTRSNISQQVANWLTVNTDLATFDAVVFAGGYNDAENFTPAAIEAAVLLALQNARALLPAAVFFVFGSFSGGRGPDAATIACEVAIQAAVIAFADSLTYFIPVSTDTPPWFTGTGYQGATNGSGNSDYYVFTDNTHPNETGHGYLARLAAKAIRNTLSGLAY
jgi:lysophospholipase L1-like esterase